MKAKLTAGFSRKEKVVLYVLSETQQLVDAGLVNGPKIMTKLGQKAADELRQAGFKPNRDEIDWAIDNLFRKPVDNADQKGAERGKKS